MGAKSEGKTESHTVVRRMQIREVEDDLSAMTVEYQEPKAQGRRRRGGRRVGASYVMVDAVSLAQLRLAPLEARVLWTMVAHMDRGNSEVRMNQDMIAKKTGILPSAVSRTMPALIERNLVMKVSYGLYRVSPWIAYIGEWREWDQVAHDWAEPIWRVPG